MVIVCAGVVLASLDLFIVNVALPDIARDLHERSLGDLSWILNAYAIVYASLLVLFGRLSESRRRENGFLLGVAVFTAASAACGAASSLTMLVAFRIVQAAGAALLTPTSLSLVLATSAPERRQSAVRAWTAIGGLAAALGPVVGGLLVAASWRWVFYVNVPIGLAAMAAGWRRLPRVPGHPVPAPSALGAGLVTAGVGTLTLGLVKGNDWGWGSPATVLSLTGAVVALALFALHCARARNPLIDASLFRIRAFTGSSVVAIVFSIAFGAMLLSLVLWCQDVWGWTALQTGLAVAPGPLMVPLFSFLVAGRLIARYRTRSGHRRGRDRLRGRRHVVDSARGPRPQLRRPDAARNADDRDRRGVDVADVHVHRRRVAATALIRHRLGGGQHAAPGRTRRRRRGAGGGDRHSAHARRAGCRVPGRLDRHRLHGDGGRAQRSGPTQASARSRP